jgi:arabinogalactan oligomer/maltooligosaccharide transport system substrate-binding protein
VCKKIVGSAAGCIGTAAKKGKSMKRVLKTVLAVLIMLTLLPLSTVTPANAKAKKLAAPKVTKKTSSDESVTIEWKSVKGADGYIVYMYSGKQKKYISAGTVEGAASTSYTVTGLKSKTTYKFKIASYVEKKGKPSAQKKTKVIKVKTQKAVSLKNCEYDITVWINGQYPDKKLAKALIEEFNKTNSDGIKFNAEIETMSCADAATQMITDVDAGADLYVFAQDQLSRLAKNGALAVLSANDAETVRKNNLESAVKSVTEGDAIYAYPISADDGYFLFYNRKYISDEDAKTVDGILKACKKNNCRFSAQLTTGWYLAGVFFGAGCESTWETNEEGVFVSHYDTFSSDMGLKAAKGIYQITSSGVWTEDYYTDEITGKKPCAAIISGVWDTERLKEIWGENLCAAKLPIFTVDGETFQMGSFSSGKAIGVKPQSDTKKAACLSKLAAYLSGEECQKKRFEECGAIPSNKKVAASKAVQSNIGYSALLAQDPYSVPQRYIIGKWWNFANDLGKGIVASDGSEGALEELLLRYKKACASVFDWRSPDDGEEVYSVIGGFSGSDWYNDYDMVLQNDGRYYKYAHLSLKSGDQFKVRRDHSWDVNYGQNGQDSDSVVVEEDGDYTITFDSLTGMITLEKE